jgi:hypothetical protein
MLLGFHFCFTLPNAITVPGMWMLGDFIQKDTENWILMFCSLIVMLKDVSCNALHMNGLTHWSLQRSKCEFWGFHSGAIEVSGLLGCDAVWLGELLRIFLSNMRNHLPNNAVWLPRRRDPWGSSYVVTVWTSFLRLPYSYTMSLSVFCEKNHCWQFDHS